MRVKYPFKFCLFKTFSQFLFNFFYCWWCNLSINFKILSNTFTEVMLHSLKHSFLGFKRLIQGSSQFFMLKTFSFYFFFFWRFFLLDACRNGKFYYKILFNIDNFIITFSFSSSIHYFTLSYSALMIFQVQF